MTKERELLRRALESFDWMDVDNLVTDDIRAYLNQSEIPTGCATEPEAEPVEIVPREWRNTLQKLVFLVRFQTGNTAIQSVCNEASLLLSKPYLYTKPSPARKPLTEEEIDVGFNPYRMRWLSDDQYFVAGVRWAEKMHKIGESNA